MDKKFIIIHPSDIFRKGLHAVFEEIYFIDPVCAASVNDISTEIINRNDEVFLFVDPELYLRENTFIQQRFIGQFKCKLFAVVFFDNNLVRPEFDATISIFDDSKMIFSKLEKFLPKKSLQASTDNSCLSQREKDILREVALGFSNKEIADRLFISIHTVISHRKNITEKLGIKSISGLTVYAIINGIISTDNIDMNTLI
ncbi:MAG: helix-turn-helix transcriptional regulator [Bacteroidales bacterium]|nr:helix-turn-helix transcriptional regulator [Bacteroidales bacterium]